eukprot:gene10326-12078_t
MSTSVSEITYFWQTEPIVSVYVPNVYQGGVCSTGYEAVSFDDWAIQSLSSGPCGCAHNTKSYLSTSTECSAELEESDVCMSLSPMPALLLSSWLVWLVPMLCCKKDAGLYCEGNYNCHILFPLLMCTLATTFFSVAFSKTVEWKELYTEIDGGDCTDPITTNMMLDQLDPLVGQWEIMLATMVLMWLFTACIITDKLCCPVENPENRDNDNQHPNFISEWIERYRLDFYLRGSYSTNTTTTNYPTTTDYHNIPVPTTAAVCSQAQHFAHTYTAVVLPPSSSSKARSNSARHTRNNIHNATRNTTRNSSSNTMSAARSSVSTQTVPAQQILHPNRISSDPIGRRNHYCSPPPLPAPAHAVSLVRSSDQSLSRPRLLSPQGSNKLPPPLSQ